MRDEREAAPPGGVAETIEQDPAEPAADVIQKLRVVLATSDSVRKSELRSMFDGLPAVDFEKALWSAREQIRDAYGVVFRSKAGVLSRATERQKINRALTFRRTALKKLRRTQEVLSAVDETALAEDDRGRLQLAQEKTGRMVVETAYLNRKRKIDTTVNEPLPEFPARPR